jgi:NDP-sugar pyrophosphorylase family protein
MIALKAAILAGGAGTRLYPITAYVPKALLPIGNRYVIEYIVDYLKHNEFELIRNQLGDGTRYGAKVEYSVADRIGTAGALGEARNLLGDRFVVYYGDVLTQMRLKDMIRFHADKKADCTIALSRSVPIEYGVARVSDDGRITYFEEKPILKEYPVSMGIYVLQSDVLSYCKPKTDLAHDVIPSLLEDRKPVYAYLTERRHYDIGTFKSLEEIRALLDQGKTLFEES